MTIFPVLTPIVGGVAYPTVGEGVGVVPWTPTRLSGTNYWWDASDLGAGAVASWTDKIGGKIATQSTGSKQPTASATSLSGKPGVLFAPGSQQHLVSDGAVSQVAATIFAVIYPTGTATGAITGQSGANGGGPEFRINTSTNKLEMLRQGTASLGVSTGAAARSAPHIVIGQYDTVAGKYNFRIDGSGSGSAAASGALSAGVVNLGSNGGSTEFFDGYIGQIIYSLTYMSLQDMQRLEGWAASLYGIQSILPSNHLYKSEAPAVGVAPLYMGCVATRCMFPNAFASSTFSTWIASNTYHFARDTMVNPRVTYANVYVPLDSSNVETLPGAGLIDAYLEYPVGVFTRCAGGEQSLPNGFTDLSFAVTVANGDRFRMWVLTKNANGTPFQGGNGFLSGEGFSNGTGTAPDLATLLGSGITQTSGNLLLPVSICSSTRKVAVLFLTDSRGLGSANTVVDASGDCGDLAPSIGPSFGYAKYGSDGTKLVDYLASNTYRSQLINRGDWSHIIDAYGQNDLASRTYAQLIADRGTVGNLYSNAVVVGTTIYNATTTSDGWTTLAGQAPTANPASGGFNGPERAGIRGEAFYFDVSRGIDPSDLGKFPPQGATPTTSDGIHANNLGSSIIKASGVINPALMVR